MRLRVTLLSSDELRELGRVTQEENRGVVLHGSAAATVSLSFESTCPSEIETHVDMVPVALLGPELDGETARVACRVGRSTLATDSRETSSGAGLVSDLAEELGAGEIGDVVGDLKDAVRSASLGVDNTLPADAIRQYLVAIADPLSPPDLRNALAVKVREQVDQVEVLEEERSVRAGTLSSVRLLNGSALRRGIDGAVTLFWGRSRSVQLVFVSVYRAAHLLEDFLRWHF